MAAQWPCVCLQALWEEVQDQQQHQETQEACVCGEPRHRNNCYNLSMLVKDHHLGDHPFDHEWGGGEEEDGSVQFKEEGRHPLPPEMENYCLINIIFFICHVFVLVFI